MANQQSTSNENSNSEKRTANELENSKMTGTINSKGINKQGVSFEYNSSN